MKKNILLPVSLLLCVFAQAQDVKVLRPAVKHSGDSVVVSFDIKLDKYPTDFRYELTPMLKSKGSNLRLIPITSLGRNKRISENRKYMKYQNIVSAHQDVLTRYEVTIPYEAWVCDADLVLERKLVGYNKTIAFDQMNLLSYKLPLKLTKVEQSEAQKAAHIAKVKEEAFKKVIADYSFIHPVKVYTNPNARMYQAELVPNTLAALISNRSSELVETENKRKEKLAFIEAEQAAMAKLAPLTAEQLQSFAARKEAVYIVAQLANKTVYDNFNASTEDVLAEVYTPYFENARNRYDATALTSSVALKNSHNTELSEIQLKRNQELEAINAEMISMSKIAPLTALQIKEFTGKEVAAYNKANVAIESSRAKFDMETANLLIDVAKPQLGKIYTSQIENTTTAFAALQLGRDSELNQIEMRRAEKLAAIEVEKSEMAKLNPLTEQQIIAFEQRKKTVVAEASQAMKTINENFNVEVANMFTVMIKPQLSAERKQQEAIVMNTLAKLNDERNAELAEIKLTRTEKLEAIELEKTELAKLAPLTAEQSYAFEQRTEVVNIETAGAVKAANAKFDAEIVKSLIVINNVQLNSAVKDHEKTVNTTLVALQEGRDAELAKAQLIRTEKLAAIEAEQTKLAELAPLTTEQIMAFEKRKDAIIVENNETVRLINVEFETKVDDVLITTNNSIMSYAIELSDATVMNKLIFIEKVLTDKVANIELTRNEKLAAINAEQTDMAKLVPLTVEQIQSFDERRKAANVEAEMAVKTANDNFNKEVANMLTTSMAQYLNDANDSEDDFSNRASLEINFLQSESAIRNNFSNNIHALKLINDALSVINNNADFEIRKIVIGGSSSPEGNFKYNEMLAKKRAQALVEYLSEFTPASKFDVISLGEDWNGLKRMVQKSNMPYKNQILDIINNYTVEQGRKTKLKNLKNGVPYRYLLEQFYPKLRSASYIQVYYDVKQDIVIK